MAKVTFNCTQCSTRIETSDGDANVRFECPTCGKSLTVEGAHGAAPAGRGLSRRVRGMVAGLVLILLGVGLAVYQLSRPATAEANPASSRGRRPLAFLQWDKMTWEGWMQGRNWRVSTEAGRDGGLLGQTENGTDVALRFRADGLPATLTIVSRGGGDELKNCLKAAYTIDPYLAREFATMVKVAPEVMTNGRLYQLGESPYAMGGGEGNALVLDYVGKDDKRRDVRRLPAEP